MIAASIRLPHNEVGPLPEAVSSHSPSAQQLSLCKPLFSLPFQSSAECACRYKLDNPCVRDLDSCEKAGDVILQMQKRRSAQTHHERRNSATPKRAQRVDDDAGPSSPSLPPQQVAEMQMEASQGGATAGSPPGQNMGKQAEVEPSGNGQNREAPQTLVSRITRFAGIFTGRKSMTDVQIGACSNLLKCVLTTDFKDAKSADSQHQADY